MSVVVFAWGNESRGDDGLGPLLGAHVEAQWPEVTLVTDFQLQLEHALDLGGHDLALFVDAGHDTAAPFEFREIEARPGMAHTSHALAPESLLGVALQIGIAPPPAFVLCIAGCDFCLGKPLTLQAQSHLIVARDFLDRLLAAPDPRRWRLAVDAIAERNTLVPTI